MRTGEARHRDRGVQVVAEIIPRTDTEVGGAGAQPRQQSESKTKVLRRNADDDGRRRSQRLAVHGVDEQRLRSRRRVGDAVERPGAKGRPPLLILEDALPRWSPDSFASNPIACKELADRIGNAGGDAEIAYRDAFAYFVEFFVDRPERPTRAFAPIYAMLIRIVAWNGVVTSNELELASAVVQALVNVAPSKDDYVEAIDAYSEIVSTNSAPGNLDWALNASEMLAFQASPDSESRLRFFLCVVGMARACSHRLSSVQYDLLTLLAKDYGCSGLVESFSAGDGVTEGIAHRIDFTGLIGIYTLTEQAGQIARQYLRKLFPHARVELNADHVATDKLKGLAANAYIFVFAWKSSKHQAYFAAKDARGSQRTLLPVGKGSASILDCVLTEIGAND